MIPLSVFVYRTGMTSCNGVSVWYIAKSLNMLTSQLHHDHYLFNPVQ